MKFGARSLFEGTVAEVAPGVVDATVMVEIDGGNVVTSSITNEAVAERAPKQGGRVTAVIK
ncbi:MAG: TOBE domain-containing protein [Sphingomonadaceae bacterium]|nr:TOBE domain-containing protein [Sphingomonadaceae bacterium]